MLTARYRSVTWIVNCQDRAHKNGHMCWPDVVRRLTRSTDLCSIRRNPTNTDGASPVPGGPMRSRFAAAATAVLLAAGLAVAPATQSAAEPAADPAPAAAPAAQHTITFDKYSLMIDGK